VKKKLLQYGITTVVGGLIAWRVMDAEGLFLIAGEPEHTKAILCDAFFVPGILLALIGMIVWVSSTGFFDALGYAVKTAAHMFIPFIKTERQSFYDYKMAKAEKRGSTPHFITFVGIAFILVSVVFLLI
jgi:hypothetical protein